MSQHSLPHRLLAPAAVVLVAAIAAACSTATLTPEMRVSAGASDTAGIGAPSLTAPAEPSGIVSPGAGDTATAAPTGAPASTPGPPTRSAWATGQTVKQDVLVSPGIGWVLTNRGLWQTIDDGSSWANAYPHSLIASSIRGFGALDANHALLAAVDVGATTSTYYVWRTTDAGRSWAYVALPPITHDIPDPCCASGPGDPPATFDLVNASTAFVWIGMHHGTDGITNFVFETTDGGAHWTSLTYTLPDPGLTSPATYRVQFMTPSIGVAEYENVVSSTTSGWGHWTHQTLNADNYSYPVVDFLGTTDWAADSAMVDNGTVHYHYAVSSDQGHTWSDHTVDVPGIAHVSGATVQFLTRLEWIGTVQSSDSGGYGTTGPSQTMYTVDGGAHWALEGAQPFNGSVATFVDNEHGWSGPNAQIPTHALYTTADRGLHWRLITP